MVFDVFHTVLLNICKNQIQRMLELELIDTAYLDENGKPFHGHKNLKVKEFQLQLERKVTG